MGANSANSRGPIWGVLTRVQNGQAIDNLARAFHLPRPQAKAAILDMLGMLTRTVDEQTFARLTLARLIELLGKNDYEPLLENPGLMGATSTQVIGTEALTALAGRPESTRINQHAAQAAGISEMIAEYLLPVVAAMFMGALSLRASPRLFALVRGEARPADPSPDATAPFSGQFPVGRGSSGVFAGAVVVTSEQGPGREVLFRELAEQIRAGGGSEDDPIHEVRQIMADGLGLRTRHAPWLARAQKWTLDNIQGAQMQIQERLSKLLNRPEE